jgi:hypothetical protein
MNLQPSTGKIKLSSVDETDECQPSSNINPPVFQKIRDKTQQRLDIGWLLPFKHP